MPFRERKHKDQGICTFVLNYFKDHVEGQLDFWGFNTDIKVSSTDLDHFEKGKGDCCDLFKRMIDKVALTAWRLV
jgi:hypothetical protein